MDVGGVTSTVRPVGALDAVRASPSQVANSAALDLPATAIVPDAGGAAASGDRRGPIVDPSADLERRVIIDPDTQEVVFQSVDDATQSVVRQYPDQAILRRKAYLQKSEEHQQTTSGGAAQIQRIV